MLGISLHDDYLSFAAVTEDADSRVIDQTGIIDLPFNLNKRELLSDKCVQDLIMSFKELKNTLEFPQNKSRLSIPSDLVSIRMKSADSGIDDDELKDLQRWETAVHFGQESYELLKKQQVVSSDENFKNSVAVFFYPKIIEHILEAAEFVRLGVSAVDINPFAAYETVQRNYDVSNYDRHSLIHFLSADTIELMIYDKQKLLKAARFRLTPSGPVFYSQLDHDLLNIARLLGEDSWTNTLFDRLGPSFVYADRNSIEAVFSKVDKTYFMELVNPFVNFEIFNHPRVIDNDNQAMSDNLFVGVAGTLFRGIEENDQI